MGFTRQREGAEKRMVEFVKAAKFSAIAAGKGIAVEIQGKRIAVFNVGGKLFALDDMCSHKGAPLADGIVSNDSVTCTWHGATFALANGAVLGGPTGAAVASYPVRLNGDDVEIEL